MRRYGVLLLAIIGPYSATAQTTITFEEFPSGTELRNQYAAKGVHFRGATIFTNNAPNSGTRVLYANDGDEVLDDLVFEGLPVTNPPPDPPKVTIKSPTANQPTNQNTFTVTGTVTGPRLDPHAVLKVHIPRPPGSSTTADFTYDL